MSDNNEKQDRRKFVVTGIMAVFAGRVLNLPAGEYVIHLDTRHATRPRWKIIQPPPTWEHDRYDDRQQT